MPNMGEETHNSEEVNKQKEWINIHKKHNN
jgi:hypothetical protein